MHWTDYPARVEKFGDLLSILETFDHDLRTNLIHSGCFDNEGDGSAYEIEVAGGGRFLPRPDRIPGWEQLATYIERQGWSELSLTTLRAIRGLVSEARDVHISAVNEMTIVEVAEVLDEARRQPATRGSGADPLLDEYRWLKVKQVARLFALNASQVSKLADAGTFVTNGKTGFDRRIDVLSVTKWVLDRLNREGGGETGTSG
jgi:hypothetical protein